MNEKYRKFRLVSRFFNLDMFYTISIDSGLIKFQGEFNSILVRNLKENKWKMEISSNGYVSFQKKDVNIVLTD